MDENVKVEPAPLARRLLRTCRQGALATLMPGSGDPYCSLVNIATLPDGAPLLLISRLAIHTKNILADHRISLMLDERAPGDPLEGARIMLSGIAEELSGDLADAHRGAAEKHEQAAREDRAQAQYAREESDAEHDELDGE